MEPPRIPVRFTPTESGGVGNEWGTHKSWSRRNGEQHIAVTSPKWGAVTITTPTCGIDADGRGRRIARSFLVGSEVVRKVVRPEAHRPGHERLSELGSGVGSDQRIAVSDRPAGPVGGGRAGPGQLPHSPRRAGRYRGSWL